MHGVSSLMHIYIFGYKRPCGQIIINCELLAYRLSQDCGLRSYLDQRT